MWTGRLKATRADVDYIELGAGWMAPGWMAPGWMAPGWMVPGWMAPGWMAPGWMAHVVRVGGLPFGGAFHNGSEPIKVRIHLAWHHKSNRK